MNIGGAKAMACMRRQKQSARSVLCGPGALCAQFSEKSGRDLFGDVPQPFFLAVTDVDKGHLREFVAAQNQVNPERREVPDKRRDKAERRDAGDPAEDERREAAVDHVEQKLDLPGERAGGERRLVYVAEHQRIGYADGGGDAQTESQAKWPASPAAPLNPC